MRQTGTWKRVLWAVDPFSSERSLQSAAAWAVRGLLGECAAEVEVEPVYVINEYPLGIPLQAPGAINEQFQEAGQQGLNRIMASAGLQNTLPLRVLSGPFSGMRGAVDSLVEYAKRSGADVIIVATHARKGLQRWFMGSFAETLMLCSDMPLFVVNPRWSSQKAASPGFRHILFPTDFSEESGAALDRVIQLARICGAEITIFHQMPYALSPALESSMSASPVYGDAVRRESRKAREEAERLAARVRSVGLEAHVSVDFRHPGSTAQGILEFARKKQLIIAMPARASGVTADLLGSTTRKVVRGARCPVWIIHEPRPAAAGTGAEALEPGTHPEKVARSG